MSITSIPLGKLGAPYFLFRAWFLKDVVPGKRERSQASLSIIVPSWVLPLMGVGVSLKKNLFLFTYFVVPRLGTARAWDLRGQTCRNPLVGIPGPYLEAFFLGFEERSGGRITLISSMAFQLWLHRGPQLLFLEEQSCPAPDHINKTPFSVPTQLVLHKSSLSSFSVSGMIHALVWLARGRGFNAKTGLLEGGKGKNGCIPAPSAVLHGMEQVQEPFQQEAGIQRNRGRCQSLVLWGTRSSGLAWSSAAAPTSQGPLFPGTRHCHPACLFSVKCGQTQGPRHAPSLLEAASASSPSLSSFLSSSICIFLYLLQRSEKQINEKKDPIILRPGSGMGGGEGSRSIK